MVVVSALVTAGAGAAVWSLFLRPRPANLTGFDAINENAQRMWDPFMQIVLVICAASVPLLVWAWRRVLADGRATKAAFESRAQLAALSPEQFERWCANQLSTAGYVVTNVAGQGDHGVDLVAKKDDLTTVVQCKRYVGKRQVGEPQVRDLYGAMHDSGAARAMIVTAGEFTPQARAWAEGKPIDLWGIENLARFGRQAVPAAEVAPVAPVARSCGQCGSALVVRTNRSTGQKFYGCSRYPSCRFTQQLA